MKFLDIFRKKRQLHPYENLQMGLIEQYSMIVPKRELEKWQVQGWIESPKYRNFHYSPNRGETVILGKPVTLQENGGKPLIGKKIVGYNSYYGSYGMGGPGFLGLTIGGESEVLVYAVWGADQYTVMDDRLIACNSRYYQDYHPWISTFANDSISTWDDFSPIILESRIEKIELEEKRCIITISKENHLHQLEFLRNDSRLAPMGNGEARKDSYMSGVIGDHIVFQHKDAVLWV